MEHLNIPIQYQRVMPYLIVRNATSFIGFLKSVFGAEEQLKHMRDEQTVMHAEMRIGDSTIMVADATEEYGACTAGMFIYVADADVAYTRSLELGATPVMSVADMPYGRSGGVKDTWGNTWWITTHKE